METELTKRYKEVFTENQGKLARLKLFMKKHREQHKQHPRNWGYPAEMLHLRKLLSEILEFMGDETSC